MKMKRSRRQLGYAISPSEEERSCKYLEQHLAAGFIFKDIDHGT